MLLSGSCQAPALDGDVAPPKSPKPPTDDRKALREKAVSGRGRFWSHGNNGVCMNCDDKRRPLLVAARRCSSSHHIRAMPARRSPSRCCCPVVVVVIATDPWYRQARAGRRCTQPRKLSELRLLPSFELPPVSYPLPDFENVKAQQQVACFDSNQIHG